jgi:hypothetical protein
MKLSLKLAPADDPLCAREFRARMRTIDPASLEDAITLAFSRMLYRLER